MLDESLIGDVPLVPAPVMDVKHAEKQFTAEEVKAIKGRKNYIEVTTQDSKGHVIGTMRVNVRILDYKFSWGWNKFLVTPLSGEGSIWKEWKQLKVYESKEAGLGQ